MQNQQIFSKIQELEAELKMIKAQIQKKPAGKKLESKLWSKINLLDLELIHAKGAIFDFDVEKFVTKQDVVSWK
jgi:hypothetical protein